MPLPRGLKFDDRLAPYKHPKFGDGFAFVCQRRGHKRVEEFVPGFKSDAKAFRAAHDTAYHNATFKHVGFEPAKNIAIEKLCAEWKEHVEQLEVDGRRDPATTRHYYLCCDYIERGMKAIGVAQAREIDPSRLSDFVHWMRKHSKSEGSLIVKTISALKTMITWKGIPADWKIPHDDIRAHRRVKRDLDADTIRRLISKMPSGSVEEAIAYLKARTGARDVEVLEAKQNEFDLEEGLFAPVLHSKRKQKRHVYAITRDAIEKVRPFVARSAAGARVFVDESGRPMTRELLRPRIRAASKRAGFVKVKKNKRTNLDGPHEYDSAIGEIDSLAQIRSEVVTLVADAESIDVASKHLGHESAETTLRWYYKDRVTQAKVAEKRRIAEIIASALPLGL